MEYLKINKYVLRMEPASNSLFNLYVTGKTLKGEHKETIVAYGVSLKGALRIISHNDLAKADVKGWKELIQWQTKRYESLAAKLDEVDKLLRDQLEKDRPKRTPPKKKPDE